MYVSGSGGEQGKTTSDMSVRIVGNNTFSQNTADRNGGAIHVSKAQLVMRDTQLLHNSVNVTGATPAGGGGLYCDGCIVTMQDITFLNNTANIGGGAAVLRAQLADITDSTFSGNTASASTVVPPMVTAVTPSSSRPGAQETSGGGGLYLASDECRLDNLTLAHNIGVVAGEPSITLV
jgi:predicted outer membrane repeat protein